MPVEAAWAPSKTPGPLRAFHQRVRARRGMQIAVVATARKLAVLCWHLLTKDEDLGTPWGESTSSAFGLVDGITPTACTTPFARELTDDRWVPVGTPTCLELLIPKPE